MPDPILQVRKQRLCKEKPLTRGHSAPGFFLPQQGPLHPARTAPKPAGPQCLSVCLSASFPPSLAVSLPPPLSHGATVLGQPSNTKLHPQPFVFYSETSSRSMAQATTTTLEAEAGMRERVWVQCTEQEKKEKGRKKGRRKTRWAVWDTVWRGGSPEQLPRGRGPSCPGPFRGWDLTCSVGCGLALTLAGVFSFP